MSTKKNKNKRGEKFYRAPNISEYFPARKRLNGSSVYAKPRQQLIEELIEIYKTVLTAVADIWKDDKN